MSALIGSLFAAWWPQIIGGIAALVGLAGVYLKGRGDAKARANLEDVTNANQIRKDGAAARAGADTSKLHDDGFRRD